MSALPLFFQDQAMHAGDTLLFPEDSARHIVQVLRMKAGDRLALTNGKGLRAEAVIVQAEKKKCAVSVEAATVLASNPYPLHLAMAFTKNSSRNEWLLEKATELGAGSITPLLTRRSERERFRFDRLNNILVSALLQSQQYYLPILHEPKTLESLLRDTQDLNQRLVAHCIEDSPRQPVAQLLQARQSTLFLIGPEGDFTEEEVALCYEAGCKGVSLCDQRLRTETAAMAVCAYFNLLNHE
jgi:16S rRNA (uracil1498-N3)-methyltransferase